MCQIFGQFGDDIGHGHQLRTLEAGYGLRVVRTDDAAAQYTETQHFSLSAFQHASALGFRSTALQPSSLTACQREIWCRIVENLACLLLVRCHNCTLVESSNQSRAWPSRPPIR